MCFHGLSPKGLSLRKLANTPMFWYPDLHQKDSRNFLASSSDSVLLKDQSHFLPWPCLFLPSWVGKATKKLFFPCGKSWFAHPVWSMWLRPNSVSAPNCISWTAYTLCFQNRDSVAPTLKRWVQLVAASCREHLPTESRLAAAEALTSTTPFLLTSPRPVLGKCSRPREVWGPLCQMSYKHELGTPG